MNRFHKKPLWLAVIIVALLCAYSVIVIRQNQASRTDDMTVQKLTRVVQALFVYSAAHDYKYPSSINDSALGLSSSDLPEGFTYTTGSYEGYAYATYPEFTFCVTFRQASKLPVSARLPDDVGNDVFGIGSDHDKGKQCYTGKHDAKGDSFMPGTK